MISQNSLQLMEALLSYGHDGAHREALLQRAKVSTATFYRALNPLLKLGLVEERAASTYMLPLEHPHNYSFKLWHDQQKLIDLPASIRDEVYRLFRELHGRLADNLLALWLHGSAAQNNLQRDSDVDFLAVLRKEQDVELPGTRTVQVTVLSEKRFRADFQQGDPFVKTILAHGLVLFDRDFAQQFYSQPPAAPSSSMQKERSEMRGDLRSRLLLWIRAKDQDEGAQALSSLAVAVTRSMLEELGQLPAGKGELVDKARFYFGPVFAQLVERCIEKRAEMDEWLRLQDDLLFWQERFVKHSAAIFRVVDGLSGAPIQVEEVVGEMLKGLTPMPLRHYGLMGQDQSYDFVMEAGSTQQPIYFIVKSLKSRVIPKHFAKERKHAGVKVVIANQLKDIPMAERPGLIDSQLKRAKDEGFALIDSVELFQYWMRSLLGVEIQPPKLVDLIAERLYREENSAD